MAAEQPSQSPKTQATAAPPLTEEEIAKKKRKEEARKAAKAAKLAKFDAKKTKQQEQQQQAAEKKKDKKDKPSTTPLPATPPQQAVVVPIGEKKDVRATEMASAYHPPAVESSWYAWWERAGFFQPRDDPTQPQESFVIVIPPPNVTGALHLGHALTNSIQDAIVRWHRMLGHRTLWVPGMDHAGISTQVVVEKKLMRERGLTRHDLGREAFVSEVWKWKEQYGGNIVNQLRRIGSSIDWSREVFTMDEDRSRAVTEAFVRLHDAGLIYRDNRLVNWCCTLRTAISDIEVEYIDVPEPTKLRVPGHEKPVPFGELVHFAYKVADAATLDEEVICATTRIETMLADTAVAIHPNDPRYTHLHGKFVLHPFTGKRIPIVCDGKLVDMSFGTGCVKVTPAHDQNDYECGLRNGLEIINMLNPDGTLNEFCGKFAGMKRFEARQAVLDELKSRGLYRKTTPNPMRVALCSRSKDIIEPRLVPQWYVNCKQAAAQSVAAVREGRIEIVPKIFEQDWYHWLENIRDWCVSRQLWWGHRIPAYLVSVRGGAPANPMVNDSWVTGRTEAEARSRASKKLGVPEADILLEQDPDVLDTWFSSGLFPFSVFRWPEQTADLQKFFPTTLLETGSDILFFWVARMVMMSLMLTGREPFSHVMLHAMVRDAHGRKMSKTLGNVVDPIDVIEGITLEKLHEKLLHGNLAKEEVERAKSGQRTDFPNGIAECGTDAMRFALCAYTSQARDINLDINRVVGYRNFCNKIWNAVRFSLSKLGPDFAPASAISAAPASCSSMDRWILSKLARAVHNTNAAMKAYDLSEATTALYSFWLYELCDVYLESIKPIFGNQAAAHTDAERAAAREVLYTCVETGLRLLHPFMPFVTEELWQRLPRRTSDATTPSIMLAQYPVDTAGYSAMANETIEADVTLLLDVAHAARALNAPYVQDIKKSGKKPRIFYRTRNQRLATLLDPKGAFAEPLRELCGFVDGLLQPLAEGAPTPAGSAVQIVGDCEVFSELRGIVDPDAELAKLAKRRQAAEAELATLRAKITDPLFETKTPQEVRDATRAKISALEEELRIAAATANSLASMRS